MLMVRITFLAISVFWLATAALGAAGEAAEGPTTPLAELSLLEMRGDFVPVRYTPGSLQRAAQIQPPFELLAGLFAKWSGQSNRLPVWLLSREEWDAAGVPMPYGTVARVQGESVAVAAWGDDRTVKLWRGLLTGKLPEANDAPYRDSANAAASLVPGNLLALFEGARILLSKADLHGSERWVDDLMAHTVALSVVARIPGEGVPQAEAVYRALAGRSETSGLGLSAYQAGLSLEDWLWFQAQFFVAARAILEEEQRDAGKSIVKLARKKKGAPVTPADLVRRYPLLEPWITSTAIPAQ